MKKTLEEGYNGRNVMNIITKMIILINVEETRKISATNFELKKWLRTIRLKDLEHSVVGQAENFSAVHQENCAHVINNLQHTIFEWHHEENLLENVICERKRNSEASGMFKDAYW